ncbi:NADP-dependent oxidoreductase [Pseudonocardia xishanensis]|uniref:NADP-dependent oxidoreductase n=1 Tax=Pseudonocardia xishanensis TaxID=630995 RepID=A0ABP8REU3_9PSEU
MGANRQIVLLRRPSGPPAESDFAARVGPRPELSAGEVLVRTLTVSVDPAMRGWLVDGPNYAQPVPVGEPMRSFGLGEVVRSRDPGFRPGELVVGMTGWQEWAVLAGTDIQRRVDPRLAPPSTALGVLGITGLTAYVGMVEIGRPGPGATALVSTAAGAVGATAGQLASIHGARVVGLTGSEQKRRICLDTFGFDAAIDYRAEPDLAAAIARECPAGVDIYFDSVGGRTLDAALENVAVGARIPVCGTISLPPDGKATGPRFERRLLVQRVRMEGFLATDHLHRLDEVAARLAAWLADGRLRHLEEIAPTLDDAPAALVRLLEGRNLGRSLVRVADPA